MNHRRLSRALLFCASLSILSPGRIAGQQAAANSWRLCVDSLPDKDLRRVAVYIASDADDSVPVLAKPVDLLLELVAGKIRTALGAVPGQLPMGEPAVTRRNIRGRVQIVLHNNGVFAVRPTPDSSIDSAQTRGLALIRQAIKDLSAEGERVFWPEGLEGDSAVFRIFFDAPTPLKDGSPGEVDERFASVVFSLALPWGEPVSVKKLSRPSYPEIPREGYSEGYLVLQFVVDENGNLDRSTIRDLWPANRERPVGPLAEYYRLFVYAAKSSVMNSQYRPANISGCPVPQTVQQPFDFRLKRP
jgi:hypothetical protein